MNFYYNKKYIAIFSFLLIYSIIAGLFTPLSPSVEKLKYNVIKDSVYVAISIPNLNENLTQFYLKESGKPDSLAMILSSDWIAKNEDIYTMRFINPDLIEGIKPATNFDFIALSQDWGRLYYFDAYYTDTGDTSLEVFSTQIPFVKSKFHFSLPNRAILRQSIRNLFFHVPMWFAMIGLLIYSLYQSIGYLYSQNLKRDTQAAKAAEIAMYFGLMGLLTGMIWAKYTWGAFWTSDPKLNGTAIGMLAYLAYFILRSSVEDDIYRAKLSAVYNIFSFALYLVFIMILPRINDSLHPGNGGNPGFNIYEQDNIMRLIFYPAVIGWGMLAFWFKDLYILGAKNNKK